MNTENQEPLNPQTENENPQPVVTTLEISKDAAYQLDEAGKWGRFLAIIGFVFLGLIVMIGFIVSIVFSVLPKTAAGPIPFPGFLIGLIYLVMGVVYFFPVLFLYRFASGIKPALHLKDQNRLVKAFQNLKAHYRFIGILMIVGLVLYALMFVILIFTGIFTGIFTCKSCPRGRWLPRPCPGESGGRCLCMAEV